MCGTPDPGRQEPGSVVAEKGVALANVLEKTKRFSYTYDFGDGGERTQAEEGWNASSDSPKPLSCLAGENACPPEDVGGPLGYEIFLQAISDQRSESGGTRSYARVARM